MASQRLVNVITADVPPGGPHAFPHGLVSNGTGTTPTLIMPQTPNGAGVTGADETNVYLVNFTGDYVTTTLRCQREASIQADSAVLQPFYVNTKNEDATGVAGVTSVSVTAPIVNVGTESDPILGASVGSTAGTVCAGNDGRLSDERVPTNGSVTDAKVATANKDGAAATPSMRTLGTGAAQACAGNDSRIGMSKLFDTRYAKTVSGVTEYGFAQVARTAVSSTPLSIRPNPPTPTTVNFGADNRPKIIQVEFGKSIVENTSTSPTWIYANLVGTTPTSWTHILGRVKFLVQPGITTSVPPIMKFVLSGAGGDFDPVDSEGFTITSSAGTYFAGTYTDVRLWIHTPPLFLTQSNMIFFTHPGDARAVIHG